VFVIPQPIQNIALKTYRHMVIGSLNKKGLKKEKRKEKKRKAY
jgi:hypothetical protein